MRPTAKDLAKAAGVSLATIDRVLNERPNVSPKTVRRVQEAIHRIGFVRNLAAANLARNTTYRFRFILPDAGDQFLEGIVREVNAANNALKSDLVVVDVARMPIENPHEVANYLTALSPGDVGGVAIMAPESPQVRDAIARLGERGIAAVNFLSGRSPGVASEFVGINNRAAGATAARLIGRFSCREPGKVMVIAETMRARDSIERRLGFDQLLNAEFGHLRALPSLETHADPERTRKIIEHTLRHNHDVVATYVMSSESRIPLSAANEFADLRRMVIIVHERTDSNLTALTDGRIDAIIALNAGHAVRSAIRILRARIDNRESIASQDQLRIEILIKDNL